MNSDNILSLPRLLASIKRELKIIFFSILCFVGTALLYCVFVPAQYTANTSIMLDPAHAATVAELSSKASSRFEDGAIVSQIELIKSRRVAQKALEYLSSNGKIGDVNLDAVVDEALLERILKGLQVYREGKSYVLTISYTGKDPEIAAQRANAFAQAYIYDQINSFSEDSQKTAEWLQAKIRSLREQSIAANLEIQKFREANNIVHTTGGSSVNEQQLGNINANLSRAKVDVATARVKYMHSKSIIDSKNISAAVAEAFDNDVINNIRVQYLNDQKKLLELKRTLGNSHQTVQNLNEKLAEGRRLIFSEMKRLSQSYKNEYEIALAKQKSLEKNVSQLVDVKHKNDGQSFELEALEKEAEAYANLYDEYLKKYEVMQQQQSFPVAESRIITKAVAPLHKSHPKSLVLIGLSFIFGAGFGVFLALIKDNFDASFKRAGQVENSTDLHFLGFFPRFKETDAGGNMGSDFLDRRYTQSVDAPMSVQAETCRNMKASIKKKAKKGCEVIGVTADRPNAGKSATAANLALYIAQSGTKCLLIDADLRNPSLSVENFSNTSNGLSSVLSKQVSLSEALVQDSKTNLFTLPCESNGILRNADLVSSEAMQQLIAQCKEEFDCIIVDLPPLAATSDASFSSVFVDYFLLVLGWGKSKPDNLQFNLKVNEIEKDKILGVVLGEADMKKMAKNYGHTIYPEYTKI